MERYTHREDEMENTMAMHTTLLLVNVSLRFLLLLHRECHPNDDDTSYVRMYIYIY